jgi:hypothetical protein
MNVCAPKGRGRRAAVNQSRSQSRSGMGRAPSAAGSQRRRPGGTDGPARPVSNTVKEIEEMERRGNLAGLVDYMQKYMADPDSVRASMQAVTEYCLKRPTSEDAAVQMLENGGVEAIVSAMRLHIADESVGVMCAIAMRTVADTAENRVAVVEAGGVAAIAEALRLHGDNGELVKWCAAALRNLVDPVHVANGVLTVEQADFCSQQIIEEGVIGALVNALHAVQKADAVAKGAALPRLKKKPANQQGGAYNSEEESEEEDMEVSKMPVDDLPAAVDHFKAVRVLVLTMRTLAVGNLEVQAKMVVAGGLMVVEDARRRCGQPPVSAPYQRGAQVPGPAA